MKKKLFFVIFLLHSIAFGQEAWQLTWTGSDYTKISKNPKSSFKDSLSLLNYLNQFQQTAISKGYLLASCDSLTFQSKRAEVLFHLGIKFQEATLHVSSEDRRYIKNTALRERSLVTLPFTPSEISTVLQSIQTEVMAAGYPFARVSLRTVSIEHEKLDAQLLVQRGPQMTWKDIHIKGDSSISAKYISNLIGIHIGDLFNDDLVSDLDRKIEQVPYIKTIKPSAVFFTKEGAELFLYLKTEPLSSVNGVLGLQPDPLSGRVGVTGDLDLKLLNALKRGELLALNWRSIRPKTQAISIRLNLPFLFSTPIGTDLRFQLYKRDSSFLEIKALLGVQYMLRNGSIFKVFYQNATSSLLGGSAGNPNFSDLSSLQNNNYGASISRRKVDYIPNPSRGFAFSFEGAVGGRKSVLNDSADVVKSTAFRGNLSAEWFIPLAKRHVLHLNTVSEFYYADEIFQNEVFRFGGQQSLRGFNEEELYATTRSIVSVEYRYLLDKNSNVFAFFDQAIYENRSTTYYKDAPFGFGFGLSFGTRAGIFAVSYGLGKQMNNPLKLNNGKIHFGYVAYF
jgi:outer membrane protein assembly factor BamA